MKKSLICNNTVNKILVIAIPLALVTVLLLFKDSIVLLSQTFPKCPFRELTGLYCPGCGNTRSIIHLLDGDILMSLRYNIVPIILILIFAILYIEWTLIAFSKHKVVLPRNTSFWIIFVSIIMAYLLLRNFIPGMIIK